MIPKWVYLLMVQERARTIGSRDDSELEQKTDNALAHTLASPCYMEQQSNSKPLYRK